MTLGGLVDAAISSWGVLLLLLVVGKLIVPLREERRKRNKPELNKEYFREKPFLSKKYRLFLSLFGEILVFPKFYATLFGFLPSVVAIVANKALNDEVVGAFFVQATGDENIKAEQVLLWLVVYCICGCMFSIMLSFYPIYLSCLKGDILFKRFPVQYSSRIFYQFALIGSILLLGAISSMMNKLSTDELSENTNFKNILKTFICVPYILMIEFGYKGYYKLIDKASATEVLASKNAFLFGQVVSSCYLLFCICASNEMAKYILLGSLILFVMFPSTVWCFSFSRGSIPSGKFNRKLEKLNFGASIKVVDFSSFSRENSLGAKHSFWFPTKPLVLPISAVAFKTPTESNSSSRFLKTLKQIDVLAPGIILGVLACIVLTPAILLLMPITAKNITDWRFAKKDLGAIVSLPIGRSVWNLVENMNQCVYFVDAPGYVTALAYLNQTLLKLKSGGLHGQNVLFIFKCSSYLDYCTLIVSLGYIFNEEMDFDSEKDRQLQYTILYNNGSLARKERSYSQENLESELTTKKYDHCFMIEEEALSSSPSLCCFDFSSLGETKDDQSTAVVCIGSVSLNNTIRGLKSVNSTMRTASFFDIIVEEKVYDMPDYKNKSFP